jgi:hypothetical protein
MKIYSDEEYNNLEYEVFGDSIELTVKLVPSNKIKIRYFDNDGNELDADSSIDNVAKAWMWVCDCPGVDERLIRRVEPAILDYAVKDGFALTKVYYHSVKRKD